MDSMLGRACKLERKQTRKRAHLVTKSLEGRGVDDTLIVAQAHGAAVLRNYRLARRRVRRHQHGCACNARQVVTPGHPCGWQHAWLPMCICETDMPASRQLMEVRWKGSSMKGNSLAGGPALAGGGSGLPPGTPSGHATA